MHVSAAEPDSVVEAHGSANVSWSQLIRTAGAANIGLLRLGANGLVGTHAAPGEQLFVVLEGHGWVRTGERTRVEVSAGDRVRWVAGELHESGTTDGMTAIVIESLDARLTWRSGRS